MPRLVRPTVKHAGDVGVFETGQDVLFASESLHELRAGRMGGKHPFDAVSMLF